MGTIRFLAPERPEAAQDQPRCLVRRPGGGLLWLQGGQLRWIARQGWSTNMCGVLGQEILGMTTDPKGTLWFIGTQSSGGMDLENLAWATRATNLCP